MPMPLGAVGEVVVSGAGVAAGYLSGPPATAAAAASITPAAAGGGKLPNSSSSNSISSSSGRFLRAQLLCGVSTVGSVSHSCGLLTATAGEIEASQQQNQQRAQVGHQDDQAGLQQQQQEPSGLQQQQQLSVAVGPGWTLDEVMAQPRLWLRMGDLGYLTPEGKPHFAVGVPCCAVGWQSNCICLRCTQCWPMPS
jgi:acyl-CoA synthetase (AMP-forming)/AMP-acid ligase II